MQPQRVILLAIVVGSGALAFFLTYSNFSNAPKEAKRKVVFPKAPIPRGTKIDANMLEEKEWPESAITMDEKTKKPTVFFRKEEVVDRTAVQDLFTDEPVKVAKLSKDKNAGAGIQALMADKPADYVAITVPMSTDDSIAGFISSGSKVDVLLTMTKVRNNLQVRPLLTNVEILVVNKDLQTPANANQGKAVDMVTFALKKEDAMRLTLGQTLGSLSMQLRNPKDVTAPPKSLTVDQLFSSRASQGSVAPVGGTSAAQDDPLVSLLSDVPDAATIRDEAEVAAKPAAKGEVSIEIPIPESKVKERYLVYRTPFDDTPQYAVAIKEGDRYENVLRDLLVDRRAVPAELPIIGRGDPDKDGKK